MVFKMAAGSIRATINNKLTSAFKPLFLEVINESYMHNVPKDSETHFKVVVVSKDFESVPLVKRHRMVNSVLADELQLGVHALSIQAKTPIQWETSGHNIAQSPPCMGGSKK